MQNYINSYNLCIYIYTKKRCEYLSTSFFISYPAEGGGFEPPVPLRVRQFSKLVVSATHPSFLCGTTVVVFAKCDAKIQLSYNFCKFSGNFLSTNVQFCCKRLIDRI